MADRLSGEFATPPTHHTISLIRHRPQTKLIGPVYDFINFKEKRRSFSDTGGGSESEGEEIHKKKKQRVGSRGSHSQQGHQRYVRSNRIPEAGGSLVTDFVVPKAARLPPNTHIGTPRTHGRNASV